MPDRRRRQKNGSRRRSFARGGRVDADLHATTATSPTTYLRLVSQSFASWNQIGHLLRRLDALTRNAMLTALVMSADYDAAAVPTGRASHAGPYSARSACIGSMRVTRRAGR